MVEITRESKLSQNSLNGKLEFRQVDNQIIGVDSDNKNRLLISATEDDFSFKIAKPGFDVFSATDEQLIFNSSQNVLKIVKTGTLTITPPAAWGAGVVLTTSVNHDLSGLRPAFSVYANVPDYGAGYPQEDQLTNLPTLFHSNTGGDVGGEINIYSQARVDTTKLYIDLINAFTSTTMNNSPAWTFRYYIFQESAN